MSDGPTIQIPEGATDRLSVIFYRAKDGRYVALASVRGRLHVGKSENSHEGAFHELLLSIYGVT